MAKAVEEIKDKMDFLEYMHDVVRQKSRDIMTELIEYVRDVNMERYDVDYE